MEVISKDKKNIFSVQIIYPDLTLRVIVCHGPQEEEESEVRISFFESLAVEIERCKASEEIPIVMGDLNAKIDENEGRLVQCSTNGKLLLELLSECDLKAANFSKVTQGKWTRIRETKKGTERSILDYILLDDQLLSHTKELIIDEERMATPYHITKCGATRKVTYTDHCSLLLTTECSKGVYKPKREKISAWNFTAEGYDKYREESKGNMQLNSHLSVEEAYDQWQKSLTVLLHNCFGKKTLRIGNRS